LLTLTKALRATVARGGFSGRLRGGQVCSRELQRRRFSVVVSLILSFLHRLVHEVAVNRIVDRQLEIRKEHEEAIVVRLVTTTRKTAMNTKTEQRNTQAFDQEHVPK